MLRETRSAYSVHRLTASVFAIVHHDRFGEYPIIYVKSFEEPRLLVVIDTGCGTSNAADPKVHVKELKEFLETFPVLENGGKPLNPRGVDEAGLQMADGSKDYMVICTHCHYDHIGGIEPFTKLKSLRIVASGNDKRFLSNRNLSRNSLCDDMNLPTPRYTITDFVNDCEWLRHGGFDLRLQVLHTPGHTPDSLTIFDQSEHVLFTGDSFYKLEGSLPGGIQYEQPVIFPSQGNWSDFVQSLQKLIQFELSVKSAQPAVISEGQVLEWKPIRISCAHTTPYATDGLLFAFRWFFVGCVEGTIKPICTFEKRGEEHSLWESSEAAPEFALLSPTRLRDDFLRSPAADRIRELLHLGVREHPNSHPTLQ